MGVYIWEVLKVFLPSPGTIKMQTTLRLHNSTCKCVSGWPWLFMEKPIKSPHPSSWMEYRFEDNILGHYGNQPPFACMLQPSLPIVAHFPGPSLPHPEIIVIFRNTDIHSHTPHCFFAYCIPSPCMQKDNYTPPEAHWACNQDSLFSWFSSHSHPLCLRTDQWRAKYHRTLREEVKGCAEEFQPKREKEVQVKIISFGALALMADGLYFRLDPFCELNRKPLGLAESYNFQKAPFYKILWL